MKPQRVLDCKSVTEIEVLEQHQILLVLTEKTVYSFSMEALDPDDSNAAISKRGRKICHANFFKAGVCQGQQLVCCVKTSALSSTIKVYEPMDSMTKKSKKSGLAKMLASSQDVLKPLKVILSIYCKSSLMFQEFYIPTESSSIHFLRSKLCVGCARGFEVVSLDTLEAQSLLDQADTSLDFVQRKENIKPVHIERIATEFLLCYTDYSFFVNRNGWRARPDWMITWEGTPQAFSIFNPYILAFEPSFIEIRHMETGMLMHIITAKNIRMLHSSSREARFTTSTIDLANPGRSSTRTKTSSARMSSPASTSGAGLTALRRRPLQAPPRRTHQRVRRRRGRRTIPNRRIIPNRRTRRMGRASCTSSPTCPASSSTSRCSTCPTRRPSRTTRRITSRTSSSSTTTTTAARNRRCGTRTTARWGTRHRCPRRNTAAGSTRAEIPVGRTMMTQNRHRGDAVLPRYYHELGDGSGMKYAAHMLLCIDGPGEPRATTCGPSFPRSNVSWMEDAVECFLGMDRCA
jgi:hypothetical protein